MHSAGTEAVLHYDWQMDDRRLAARVGPLLASVQWEAARTALPIHSFTHHGAPAFCLVGCGRGLWSRSCFVSAAKFQ